MSILEKYHQLVQLERWPEALSLIAEIVERAPHVATSWFNYGVALDELGRHQEAAERFLEAYRLDPDDFGAQYRAFRSLSLANNTEAFLALAKAECAKMPELIDNLLDDVEFARLLRRPECRVFMRSQGQ